MSRMDQYAVGVTIDGVDWGTWDKQDGGESTAEETKFNPGGDGGAGVVGRSAYDRERDDLAAV